MSNLLQRAITGFFLILIIVSSILYSQWSCFFLFLFVNLLALNEYYTLVLGKQKLFHRIYGVFAGTVIYLLITLFVLESIEINHLAIIIPLVFLPFISELFVKDTLPFSQIGLVVLGWVYVALPFSLLLGIGYRDGFYEANALLSVFILMWASDTFAYIVGRKFGKRKLFERISPKKTVEGFFGGMVLTMTAAWFLADFAGIFTRADWAVIGMIMVVIGMFGDLTESMLKRSLNIKDSGKILPGHGGILDRFDGLILAVPFVFAYILLRHVF